MDGLTKRIKKNIPIEDDSNSFIEILEKRAIKSPTQIAYTFIENGLENDNELSYESLYSRVKNIAALIQSKNLKGNAIILLYRPSLDYVVGYFACLFAGAIAVPVHTPTSKKINSQLLSIITNSNSKAILTTENVANDLSHKIIEALPNNQLKIIITDVFNASIKAEYTPHYPNPKDIAFLQYTSGSTSAPKGVVITHYNLMTNSQSIKEKFGHTTDTNAVIWLPPYHDMGLIGGILQPLYVGFPVVLMSPFDVIQKPLRWLQAISKYKANTSGSPDFFYDLCVNKIQDEDSENLDLSSWDVAFSGGEIVRKETIESFSNKFKRCGFQKTSFLSAYGMAEATLIISSNHKNVAPSYLKVDKEKLTKGKVEVSTNKINAKTLVGSGSVIKNSKISVINTKTNKECEEREIGEVWFSGPSMTKEYVNNIEATKKSLEKSLAIYPNKKFLRTGDLGFIHKGELFITGREKDMIIIRGRNYYPQDIEWCVAESHVYLAKNRGATFSIDDDKEEKLVIVQELVRGYKEESLEDVFLSIRKNISSEFNLKVTAIVLVRPYSILKTSSGKIRRQACKKAYQSNTLKVVKQKGNKSKTITS